MNLLSKCLNDSNNLESNITYMQKSKLLLELVVVILNVINKAKKAQEKAKTNNVPNIIGQIEY